MSTKRRKREEKYQTKRGAEYIPVAELTEQEAKCQLCDAMDVIKRLGSLIYKADLAIEEWER